MKLRNKKTGEVKDWDFGNWYQTILNPENEEKYECNLNDFIDRTVEFREEWEDYKPAEPLIKDEKIRKVLRAWAEALDLNEGEVEFYGNKTWIGFRPINNRTGWSSKFELDYFGSENEFVPFKRYTITELCGEEEE